MASGDPRIGVAYSWRRSDIPTKSKEDDTKPTLYHTDTPFSQAYFSNPIPQI